MMMSHMCANQVASQHPTRTSTKRIIRTSESLQMATMSRQITRQRHGWQATASALRAPAPSQDLLSKLFQLRERRRF